MQLEKPFGPRPAARVDPAAPRPWVLLVDDGELEDVEEITRSFGAPTRRHARGDAAWRQPQRLLVVSDRRAPGLGRPAMQEQDDFVTLAVLDRCSRTLREQIHKMGFDLVVERPVAHEALRDLLRDALYRGREQRVARRLPVGYPVSLRAGWRRRDVQLVELSERGCSLRVGSPLGGSRRVAIEIPAQLTGDGLLRLEGTIVRECSVAGRTVVASMVFHLDDAARARLGLLVGTLASGPPLQRSA